MKPYKIDTLDLNIIEMLEEDCSLTYNEIAEKTGKTLWTVRDRMVLLRKRGIIRGCRADIDYSKLGYGCRALIGFNVPADKIDAIVSFVKTQKRIRKLIVSEGAVLFQHFYNVKVECIDLVRFQPFAMTSVYIISLVRFSPISLDIVMQVKIT